MVKRVMFWAGWILLVAYTLIYAAQIYLTQDLPHVSVYKWAALFATGVMIFFSRDTDEPIHHHLPH